MYVFMLYIIFITIAAMLNFPGVSPQVGRRLSQRKSTNQVKHEAILNAASKQLTQQNNDKQYNRVVRLPSVYDNMNGEEMSQRQQYNPVYVTVIEETEIHL
jgi:hypothetical protein